MIRLDTNPDIRDQYNMCLSIWGKDTLPRLEEIHIVWSHYPILYEDSLVIGETTITGQHYTIEILKTFFDVLARLSPECAIRMLIIVVCHELAHVSYGYTHPIDELDHGPEFKGLMRRLGLPFEESLPYDIDAKGNMVIPETDILLSSLYDEVTRSKETCPATTLELTELKS